MKPIEQTIADELEVYKKVPHELCGPGVDAQDFEVKGNYLREFYRFWLPEKFRESMAYIGNEDEWWNVKHVNKIAPIKDWKENHERVQKRLRGHSELYLSQTPRQFRDALHQACTSIGLEVSTVETLVGESCDSTNTLLNARNEFFQKYSPRKAARMARELSNKIKEEQKWKYLVEHCLFPLYVEARRMGYSHKDLRGM